MYGGSSKAEKLCWSFVSMVRGPHRITEVLGSYGQFLSKGVSDMWTPTQIWLAASAGQIGSGVGTAGMMYKSSLFLALVLEEENCPSAVWTLMLLISLRELDGRETLAF